MMSKNPINLNRGKSHDEVTVNQCTLNGNFQPQKKLYGRSREHHSEINTTFPKHPEEKELLRTETTKVRVIDSEKPALSSPQPKLLNC